MTDAHFETLIYVVVAFNCGFLVAIVLALIAIRSKFRSKS
jgi:ABC-type nitrate/sulfonate/bicarbonate transport system permease component